MCLKWVLRCERRVMRGRRSAAFIGRQDARVNALQAGSEVQAEGHIDNAKREDANPG